MDTTDSASLQNEGTLTIRDSEVGARMIQVGHCCSNLPELILFWIWWISAVGWLHACSVDCMLARLIVSSVRSLIDRSIDPSLVSALI